MTDKISESNFSFRMFDLYRRFVELLQLHPDYIQDFRVGTPTKEICENIIKKVFRYAQTKEKIEHLTEYLIKNSKAIAAHAENNPHNWKAAIKYTDACIKLIQKYIKKKGINLKVDIDSIPELAKEIGTLLHNKPNENQVEAIREYLKYDLHNPKKTIQLASKKCKRKTSKVTKCSKKIKNTVLVETKKSTSEVATKKLNNDSLEIKDEGFNNKQHLTSNKSSSIKQSIVEAKTCSNSKELIENKLSSDNNQTLMKNKYHHALNDNHDKNESKEKLLRSVTEQESYLQEAEISSDKLNNVESIKYISRDSLKSYQAEDYLIIEIDETSKIELSDGREEFQNSNFNQDTSENKFTRKRKSSMNSKEDNHCIKKLLLPTVHNNQYVTISYDQFLHTNKDSDNGHDTDNSEIIVVDDIDDHQEIDNNLYITYTEDEPFYQENKQNALYTYKREFNNQEKKFVTGTESKYSDVVNMSYTEALKLAETLMAFCELRNEISLEEFLVLRRTRDKMEWRSLKEAEQ